MVYETHNDEGYIRVEVGYDADSLMEMDPETFAQFKSALDQLHAVCRPIMEARERIWSARAAIRAEHPDWSPEQVYEEAQRSLEDL